MLRAAAALAAALAALQPLLAAHAEGDAARGERVFQRCYSCHSVDSRETAKLQGPSLFKIVGRPAAAIAGFEYSDAMRAKASAGLVWSGANLDRYLADPEGFVPGTLMSVPPLRDEDERADLIAYLAFSGSERPPPSAGRYIRLRSVLFRIVKLVNRLTLSTGPPAARVPRARARSPAPLTLESPFEGNRLPARLAML